MKRNQIPTPQWNCRFTDCFGRQFWITIHANSEQFARTLARARVSCTGWHRRGISFDEVVNPKNAEAKALVALAAPMEAA